jgi:hypothetical protein
LIVFKTIVVAVPEMLGIGIDFPLKDFIQGVGVAGANLHQETIGSGNFMHLSNLSRSK